MPGAILPDRGLSIHPLMRYDPTDQYSTFENKDKLPRSSGIASLNGETKETTVYEFEFLESFEGAVST